jgi:hypothetical protein
LNFIGNEFEQERPLECGLLEKRRRLQVPALREGLASLLPLSTLANPRSGYRYEIELTAKGQGQAFFNMENTEIYVTLNELKVDLSFEY